MRAVLAHAQLAVGRVAPARATAERALTEVAQVAGLREAVGRSTAPGLCRVWWALAGAHLGRTAEAEAALEALLAEESDARPPGPLRNARIPVRGAAPPG